MSLLRYLPSFRLRALLVALAVVAPTLALVAQHDRADERERELKFKLRQENRRYAGEKGMRDFLGDLAIVILNDATTVEELHIDNPKEDWNYEGTPTGRVFDKQFTSRLTGSLLDPNNYGHINSDDLAEAEMAFRFRRGRDSVDVFLDASHGSHQDLWISSHDAITGKTFRNGYICLNDSRLEEVRKGYYGK